MKKTVLFLILIMVFIPFGWALCPIESSENVCTLPGSNTGMPLFQSQSSTGINSGENKSMSLNVIQQSNTGGSFNRMQNQSGIKMQGSLGCQFGNCNSENNNDFLPNQ